MKPLALISISMSLAGFAWVARGQDPLGQEHALSLPTPGAYTNANVGIGSNSKNTSSAEPSASPTESNVDGDDTIYRGSTQETDNPMLRDEGPIHFKQRPREKIQQVDSKNLHTSGIDPKFQGSLLHSSVSSIDDVGDKINEAPAPKAEQTPVINDPSDPRFRTRRLIFTPETADKSKKKEDKPNAEADSSPSPSPSASASPVESKR